MAERSKCISKPRFSACKEELEHMTHCPGFKAIAVAELIHQEKEQAMEGLIFLTQKRDGKLKAQLS